MDNDISRENEPRPVAVMDEAIDAGSQTGSQTGPEDSNTTPFFPVSEGKLITMYLLSLGFYGIYWFYKNWKLQQPVMDKNIYPVWRSIFSIFFAYSLFRRIDLQSGDMDHSHRFNPGVMATFFIVTVVIGHFLDKVSTVAIGIEQLTSTGLLVTSLILFVVSTYPLVRVQATVNRLNDDMLGYLNHKFSIWNYLLIAAGTLFWSLMILGIVFESMGLTATA